MTPEAGKDFARLLDLMGEGKLPKYAMPRLFNMGHEMVCGYHKSMRQYKCIKCEHEWEAKAKDTVNQCPSCKVVDKDPDDLCSNFIFDVTNDWVNRWRCERCKHEWDAEDGTKCPECKACTKNGVLVEEIIK